MSDEPSLGPGDPDPGSGEPGMLTDVDQGSLSWPSVVGRLEVRPIVHRSTARRAPHATIMVAGHEITVADARMVASYLTDLCTALER